MPVDPNWLPATTAQSAAAMVAIIGGFLVSRLVSLAGQRQSLAQRVNELHDERKMVSAEFSKVARERRAESFDIFRSWVADRLAEERGVLSADLAAELLEEVPRSSNTEELRPYLEELAAKVRLFAHVVERSTDPEKLSVQALQQQEGLDVDDDDAHLLRLVREAEEQRRNGGSPMFASALGSGLGPNPTYQALDMQRQDARITREGELRSRLALLAAQTTITQRELSAIRSPREVWVGLGALTYLALVGVVFPLYLATRRPVPDSPGMRTTIVVLFCTGLAALLGYVVWSLMRLQRPVTTTTPCDSDTAAASAPLSGAPHDTL